MNTLSIIGGVAAIYVSIFLLLVWIDGLINESVYGIPSAWKWERSRWRVIRNRPGSLVYLVRTGPRFMGDPQAVFWLGSTGHEERAAIHLARRANELGHTRMPSVRGLYGSVSEAQLDELFMRRPTQDLAEAQHG